MTKNSPRTGQTSRTTRTSTAPMEGLPPENFKYLFSSTIYNRGVSYYKDGAVTEVVRLSNTDWLACVSGTDEYNVDLEIENGKIGNMQCDCPYAEDGYYCKHMVASLLTIRDIMRGAELRCTFIDDRSPEDLANTNGADSADANNPYGNPTQQVSQYFSNALSNSSNNLDFADWQSTTRLLESMTGLPELDHLLKFVIDQRLKNMLNLSDMTTTFNHIVYPTVPYGEVRTLDALPHGWLTLLECAYEHTEDTRGLVRLYMLYILLANNERDCMYVDKLKERSGENWHNDLADLLAYADSYIWPLTKRNSNPAFEHLIRSEGIAAAALKYCEDCHDDLRIVRFLDLLADVDYDGTLHMLGGFLDTSEAPIYQKPAKEIAADMKVWMDRITEVFGKKEAAGFAMRITDMFPRKRTLCNVLKGYLPKGYVA